MKKIILGALTAGILAAVAFALFANGHAGAGFLAQSPASTSTSFQTASAPLTPQAGTSFPNASRPARLQIPSIGVDAQVEPVGIAADGLMAVTKSFFTVGWYKNGPVPGAPGSAVIEGHLDQVTSPYAVFFDLDKLKPGDEVNIIDAAGRTIHFEVTSSRTEAYNAPTNDIFGSSAAGESDLNLITCAGNWIQSQHQYDQRLVVFTKRID